jgi:ACS family hexuronate transporter-like MFS transporter
LWLAVSHWIPPRSGDAELALKQDRRDRHLLAVLRERNLLVLVAANVLWMGGYSLWSNWTTLYLTHVYHLSLEATARYVWIPPLVSNLGGFFGGWLSLRWIRRAVRPVEARRKAVWVSAAGSLLTLLLPFAPSPISGTALISLSFFFALAGSVNIYALPIDIYGAKRSGVTIAALTCAFGILQTVISPIIGYLSDHRLYTQVLWLVTIPLLAGAFVLNALKSDELES